MKTTHSPAARAYPHSASQLSRGGSPVPRRQSTSRRWFPDFGRTLITVLLLLVPAVAQALDFTYTTSFNQITITGYTGPGGTVAIPSTIGGLPVTFIGSGAFSYSGVTSVTIPSGVTSIGSYAFSGCSNLTSVTIPSSVTGIGGNAFYFCTNLTSMTIPSSVTSIGDDAFYLCSSLTSVAIPSSVGSIGTAAFGSCSSLTAITVDSSNSFYSSAGGVLFNKNQTALIQFPGGKTGAYSIPTGVTSIRDRAFYTCRSLTSVTIPSSVTSIGSDVFSDCINLTSMTIPNSVTNIGASAFSYCSGLTSVYFEGNAPTTVGTDLFYNTNATVYYLSGTTGWAATFAGRPTVMLLPFIYTTSAGKITITGYTGTGGAVEIPATITGLPVTAIGSSAFSSKTSLTSVTIPTSVNTIGDTAFAFCSNLTSVTIPNSVTSIGDGAFGFCGLTNVTIPDSVTSIGHQAFDSCGNLTSVTIPASVTSIGYDAFAFCISLPSVTIPASVTSIGSRAFGLCDTLTSVVFLGNAPTVDPSFLTGGPASLTVYYSTASTGFSTPTWLGYNTVPLAAAREISVQGPSATELVDGGTAIDFGTVNPGVSVVKTFTIANVGITTLTGLAIVKDGAAAADFTVSALTASELAPDTDTTFTVTFKPSASGPRAAAIHIASNDANESPFDIALTGSGSLPPAPEISVRQTGGKSLTDGKSKLSFGNVAVKSKRSLSFTITNSGKANLTKLAVTVNGKNPKNFIVTSPGKTTLVPGASTTFKVTFKPSAAVTHKAAFHIRSNDSDENPFDVTLSGIGVAAKAAAAMTAGPALAAPALSSQATAPLRVVSSTLRLHGRKYRCLTIFKTAGNAARPDSVEVSANLTDWSSGPAHTTVVADNAAVLTVRDNTPVERGKKRFIRLRPAR